ncbi:MAG: hypothetical protein RR444_11955 [Oscillospiraceae bacterium]
MKTIKLFHKDFTLVGGVLVDSVNNRNIIVILDFLTATIITLFFLSLGKLPVVPLITVTLSCYTASAEPISLPYNPVFQH